MQLFALGMFIFELSTLGPDELQRKTDWNFASAPRLGARDAQQFLGPGTEKVSLSGTVYRELADGSVSLDQLREMGDTGEALPLVDGRGTVFGNYIMQSLDERQTYFMADGTPRRIDFAIDLLRVDDKAGADQEAAG